MVHVDEGPDAAARVEFACTLADRFDAALIGVAACPMKMPLTDPYTTGGMVIDFLQQEHDRAEACIKQAEEIFNTAAAAHKCRTEWRSALRLPTPVLAHESRAADLIIVGRDRPQDGHRQALEPGDLIMNAGRPVLVVPPAAAPDTAPSGVLIAWKESREARRAVVDALPLLQIAAKVTVAEICEDDEIEQSQRRLGDVAAFLGRHGVNADPVVLPAQAGSVADRLIAFAGRERAGLVVMGGYGHARMREWVFGGATREMLGHSPVCCLFSH
ncbi:universal stress protein [Oleomonas cavernae]|nr:universal stress protein [Oleomonas cavernae]